MQVKKDNKKIKKDKKDKTQMETRQFELKLET